MTLTLGILCVMERSRMFQICQDLSRVFSRVFHNVLNLCSILDICIKYSGCIIIAVGSNQSSSSIEAMEVYIYP